MPLQQNKYMQCTYKSMQSRKSQYLHIAQLFMGEYGDERERERERERLLPMIEGNTLAPLPPFE